jgi:hypothetical protein
MFDFGLAYPFACNAQHPGRSIGIAAFVCPVSSERQL